MRVENKKYCPKSECNGYNTCDSCNSVIIEEMGDSDNTTDHTKEINMRRSSRMTKDNDLTDTNEQANDKHQNNFKKVPKCAWKRRGSRWSCWDHPSSLKPGQKKSSTSDNHSLLLPKCPMKCSEHKSCSSCLLSDGGGDGIWSKCSWSTELSICLSPPEIPLRCLGGVCGTTISVIDQHGIHANRTSLVDKQCPKPCSFNQNCKDCLENTRCGWCALNATNGGGKCVEGTIEGPLLGKHCEYLEFSQKQYLNLLQGQNSNSIDHSKVSAKQQSHILPKTSWHYNICPPENECLNGHHNCDIKSEVCLDHAHGFSCECSSGYERSSDPKTKLSTRCKPICNPKCERGKCVAPNICECDFSFVGSICNISCDCNGHSNCAGSDPVGLKTCLDCQNNTVSTRCAL